MNIPATLKYTRSHEWLRQEPDGSYAIGLTDYAQKELGDIVYINLPAEGDEATAGEALTDVESVKAVSDIFSPITGTIAAVNEDLLDGPQLINQAPYDAWIVRITGVSTFDELLSAGEYAAFCEKAKE